MTVLLILALVIVWLLAFLFAWALCHAAAIANEDERPLVTRR